jgi:hypothetical protein
VRAARNATLLLGVGRFAPEKRWPMLVDAVAAAGSRRQVGLVLAGQGRERKTIERRIGGNPHIRVLAPITKRHELARVMASADAAARLRGRNVLHGRRRGPRQRPAADRARPGGAATRPALRAGGSTSRAMPRPRRGVAQYCLGRESGLDGPAPTCHRPARWTTISASCLPERLIAPKCRRAAKLPVRLPPQRWRRSRRLHRQVFRVEWGPDTEGGYPET